MNVYQELKAQAKQKRDRAIAAARAEYRLTLQAIDHVGRKLNRQSKRVRYTSTIWGGDDFTTITAARAAEIVLRELGPMTIAELTAECQKRGFRADEHPPKVGHALRQGMKYHGNLFAITTGAKSERRYTIVNG